MKFQHFLSKLSLAFKSESFSVSVQFQILILSPDQGKFNGLKNSRSIMIQSAVREKKKPKGNTNHKTALS